MTQQNVFVKQLIYFHERNVRVEKNKCYILP